MIGTWRISRGRPVIVRIDWTAHDPTRRRARRTAPNQMTPTRKENEAA
jgi:hypothetical protein